MEKLILKTANGEFFSDLLVWDEDRKLVYANGYHDSSVVLTSNTATINMQAGTINAYVYNDNEEKGIYGEKIVMLHSEPEKYKVFFDSKEFLNEKKFAAVIRHSDIAIKSNISKLKEKTVVYILCTEDEDNTIYNVLFNKFNIPLLKEFIPYIKRQLKIEVKLTPLKIHQTEKSYPKFISGYKLSDLSEEDLKQIIYEGFQMGILKLEQTSQKNVDVNNLDSYMEKFGGSIIKQVDTLINPRLPESENKGIIDVPLKRKPFISQARRINGMAKLLKKDKFGLFISTMGCGKTLKSLATAELMHKDKKGYKVLIMCPGHLQTNWEDEIKMTVPGAHIKILEDLKDVQNLIYYPKDSNEKWFYIIGKDFLKLSYAETPIVSWSKGYRYKSIYNEVPVINDVGETEKDENNNPIYKLKLYSSDGRYIGKQCIGKQKVSKTGWICPECGEILYTKRSFRDANDLKDDTLLVPLGRWAFSNKTQDNESCCHCNAKLWKPKVSLLNHGGSSYKETEKPSWVKVAYKTGFTASEKTAFVYSDFIDMFLYDEENKVRVETFRLLHESTGRRVAPMDFLKVKGYKGLFDLVIFDEIHKYANQSGQGAAMHSLVRLGKKAIGLTGTLFNGKAESIWYLLWRLCPHKMVKKGYKFDSKSLLEFNREYGAIEERYEYDSREDYLAQVRAKKISTARTIPGISPRLYQEFLINNCIFMDLKDIEIEEGKKILPPFDEQLITIPMQDDLFSSYKHIENKLLQFIRSKQKGSTAILGTMVQSLTSYPDKPNGWKDILNPYDGSIVSKVPNLPMETLYPKEEHLLKIIKAEVQKGRRCMIFCTSTNKHDVQPRIEKLLLKEGIKAKTMYSTTSSSKNRKQWIKTQVQKGTQVLICNPELIETGLNLIDFPTIIYLQTGYILSTLWQSSRRSWRIGQKKRVKVFYLAYENTLQERAIKLMGSKLKAAASIQGEFSSEGIQALSQNTNILTQLAEELHAKAMGQENEALATIWDEQEDIIDTRDDDLIDNIDTSQGTIKEQTSFIVQPIEQTSLMTEETVQQQLTVEEKAPQKKEREVKVVYAQTQESLFKTYKEVMAGSMKGKKRQAEDQLVLFDF